MPATVVRRRKPVSGRGSCHSALQHYSMRRRKCVLTKCGPGQTRSKSTRKCAGTVVLSPYMKYMKKNLPRYRDLYDNDPKYKNTPWKEMFTKCAKAWTKARPRRSAAAAAAAAKRKSATAVRRKTATSKRKTSSSRALVALRRSA
jgi:hypothetical protein